MKYINIVVEDELQEHLVRKVIDVSCKGRLAPAEVIGKKGNQYIRQRLTAFNSASAYVPYLVLTDLDQISCVPELKIDWNAFHLSSNLLFRVAVREAEAWLLADKTNFASYLGISPMQIDANSEAILQPKETIIRIARRSRKRSIKEDIVPQGTARQGSNYNSCLAAFIYNVWDVRTAEKNNDSLKRMIRRLKDLCSN